MCAIMQRTAEGYRKQVKILCETVTVIARGETSAGRTGILFVYDEATERKWHDPAKYGMRQPQC